VSDIQEELRKKDFNSLTGDNPPDPVSSEDEATKNECLEGIVQSRSNSLHKFHPMELFIFFHFGPTSVGDCASPYFLESVEAIQKAV